MTEWEDSIYSIWEKAGKKNRTADDSFVPGVLHTPHSAVGWLWQTSWEPAESRSPVDPAETGWIQSDVGPMGVKRQHISNQPHRFTSLKWHAKVWWVSILGYNKCLLCSLVNKHRGISLWNFSSKHNFVLLTFHCNTWNKSAKWDQLEIIFATLFFSSVFKIWSNLISLFAADIQSIIYVFCSGPKQIYCGHKLKQWATWNWNVTILLTAPQKYGATLAFMCSWAPAHLTTLQ